MAAWVFYLAKTGQNLLETRWNNNISAKLINEIAATTDQSKREEFAYGVQKLQYDRGGYIIWGFQDQVDGLGANVNGFIGARSLPLGFYSFQNAWFS